MKNFYRTMDKKQYERAPEMPKAVWDNLKDHLGNVRVAIGDMKIPSGKQYKKFIFVS